MISKEITIATVINWHVTLASFDREYLVRIALFINGNQ